jgi:hypothetical protein
LKEGVSIYEPRTYYTTKNSVKIYDLTYTLIKEINLLPLGEVYLPGYKDSNKKHNAIITQYLFNKDSKIEFVVARDEGFQVYNEDLNLIQEIPCEGGATNISFGDDVEIINFGDKSPNYKLIINFEGTNTKIYSIEGDPFITPTSTKVSTKQAGSFEFSISPNPIKDELIATFSHPIEGKLIISDSNGRLIQQINVSNSSTKLPINLSHLKSGMYYCQLITNNIQYTNKFIKSN